MTRRLPPGLGIARCGAPTSTTGRPCAGWVVAGLDRCLHHVPDDQLEAAEAILGFRRCSRCHQYAVKGTSPALCKRHGANQGSAQWVNAQLAAARLEIAEEALGLRTRRKKRLVPIKATWRGKVA
jgi:hypothetical protein